MTDQQQDPRAQAFVLQLLDLAQSNDLEAPLAVRLFGLVAAAMADTSTDPAEATRDLIHEFMSGIGMKMLIVDADDDLGEQLASAIAAAGEDDSAQVLN